MDFIIRIPVLLISLTVHEFAHGYTAFKMGDHTAKHDGRLSLNPAKHIDPLGLLFLLIFRFGWAKPVMVDTRSLEDPKKDMAIIASAGPLANIALAFVMMLILHPFLLMFAEGGAKEIITRVLVEFFYLNLFFAIFNLLPIPPLDGSKVFGSFLPNKLYYTLMRSERICYMVLIVLIWTGAISAILSPLVTALFRIITAIVEKIYFFL